MPVYLLNDDEDLFPPPEGADRHGIVAVGGSITPRRLLAAYQHGIFPWYSEGQPILWHSPNPRFVLSPDALHIPRSLAKAMKHSPFEIRYDTAFEAVMRACAEAPRTGQSGTWITDEMLAGYVELHDRGFAHSIEAWLSGTLVGGLYGVWLGSVFFGESMFAHVAEASKTAFAVGARKLITAGCSLIDCQQETEHLARFGAVSWPRSRFLKALAVGLEHATQRGHWDATRGPPEHSP